VNATIKTVVFDLGKVLVDFDYRIAVRRLAARSRMTVEEFSRFFTHSPLLAQYETGLMSSEQFYQEIRGATGFAGDSDEFAAVFGDIFTAIEPMIELQASLRLRGLPTYILSNTNEMAVRHIRNTFPFFSNFDGYVLSYEHGAMKPEPKLYQVLERHSGCQGGEILYLDDRPENVEAGVARGWQVILHESAERSVSAVHCLGLPSSPPGGGAAGAAA
jgi:HAD superfamily hydrolase (TIGR01509 family)